MKSELKIYVGLLPVKRYMLPITILIGQMLFTRNVLVAH